MSFPKLYRDLFQNDGAGNKLREEILPDIGKVKTVNGVGPDSSGNVSTTLTAYPVGSIYMSINPTNPGTLFGGTWQALDEGRVLIGAGAAHPAGEKGGEETHTLTTSEMPAHTHSGSASSSGSHSHSVYRGSRTNERRCVPEYADTGHFLFGSGDVSLGTTQSGGSHSHSLSINNTGGGAAHNNMQPFLSVYMWTRTA